MPLLLLGLAVIALTPPALAQDQRLEAIDAYVAKARAAWEAPAVAVAIVQGDSVVFAKGYGVLKAGTTTPADQHTLFAIGSSSKAFTTASLAMLIEEGKLGWDDPAMASLPGWQLADPWVTRQITIRDLVAHRVGLERADAIWSGTAFTRADIMRRQRHIKPLESFRAQFGYNNHMFLAAGQAVAKVSGMSWDDFVARRIFAPLGMTRSNTSTKAFADDPNVATPHTTIEGRVVSIPWHNIDNIGPAGSINSSVLEMAAWLRLQLGEGTYRGRRLLTAASVREMHAPQTVIPLTPWMSTSSPINHQMVPGTNFFSYGLGWFLQDYKGYKLVHHGGSIDGMRALVGMVPSEGLGFVILTNLNPSAIDEALMFRILDEYLGGTVRDWSADMLAGFERLREAGAKRAARRAATRVAGTAPSRPMTEYAGSYSEPAYGTARFRVEQGRLNVRFEERRGVLEHWHFDTFKLTWDGPGDSFSLATFQLDGQGRPVAVVIPGFPALWREKGGP